MSDQQNTYIAYGVMIPYQSTGNHPWLEDYEDDAFHVDDINKKDDLTVISDGMSGKYTFIGHVLLKTANHQGLDRPVLLPAEPKRHGLRIAEVLQRLSVPITDDIRIGFYVFTHYR